VLKILMLRKKIDQRKEALAALAEEEKKLQERSQALEGSIDEAKTDEELSVVEEEVEKVAAEKAELAEKKSKLEGEIAALEGEIKQLAEKEPKPTDPAPETKGDEGREKSSQGGETRMRTNSVFRGMDIQKRSALVAREDVREFLTRVRGLIGEKRAVTGADLTIPDVLLGLLRDNLHRYSKLISKVNLRPVGGVARQNIVGAIPEGIWTEMVATLNEATLVFNQLQVDGYKVGSYFPIPNSTIEDSDLNLADEVLTAIAQGIGLALDKAILYGTGVKMPVGIVTRLAEIAQPAYWGNREPAWTDLHDTHLVAIDKTATTPNAFFADLILKLGVVRANYSDGRLFWAMNTQTYRTLQSKAINFNAAGMVVAGVQNTVPVIGGEAVLLDFIPNNHIIGGYGSLYLLAERKGIQLAQSEHAQFIQDNTLFKGTARYDGRPVFGEAFVGLTIDQGLAAAPPAPNDVVFAPDVANP
jgi:HK97 family phage major capsid protein